MNLQIGSTVGDYQIVGMLGAGGMGKVFKVRNVISDRIEAMKVLLPDLASDTELADRFMREIKVQASLEHPHIAALHTALRIDNQLLMLMEFVDGQTLEQKLKDGPLPVAKAVEYISQVLSALDYAHSRGVVHRDIKPANMMLTPSGNIKLMDFGIAKAAADRRLTMTGTTMGSLYYMSPEQIQGAADLDSRADLYSVGVSLYELVTGKRPFDGDSQFAIMSAHLEKQPVPPITLDPSLPQALNEAILMSVAKDPKQRFQTAGAFRAALGSVAAPPRAAVAPPPVVAAAQPAPPVSLPPQAPAAVAAAAAPKSKRGLWVAMGGLAVALAIVAFIQFGPKKDASAAPQTLTEPGVAAPMGGQTPVSQPIPQSQPAAQPPAPTQSAPAPAQSRPPAISTQPQRQQTHTPPQQSSAPPVQQQAPPPQAQQQAPPPQPSRPAIDPAKQAALQQVREDLVMLQTRASGIRSSLQNLQRSQAASGLGLRGDMQEANNLMGSFLEGAVSALNAGDPTSARSFMSKAERNIEKLEKFLGR